VTIFEAQKKKYSAQLQKKKSLRLFESVKILLSHVLKKRRIRLAIQKEIERAYRQKIRPADREKSQTCPLAYLTGEKRILWLSI